MDKLGIGGMQERFFLPMPPKETKLKIENRLAEASCNLNVLQWQFVLALIAAMMPIENKMNFFMISTKEIAQLLNVTRNRKRIIWQMIDDLWEQNIYVGDDHKLRWFYELCPLELEGDDKDFNYICFRMHEGLAEYLLSYEKGYVLLCLDELLKFTCKYSFQIYALLTKYAKFKKKKMRINDLAEQLGVPNSYKRTVTHLIQKAIEPAISEINRITALDVNYQISSNYQFVCFHINLKVINIADEFFESLNPQAQVAYTYFVEIKVTKSAIIHCVNTFGQEVFEKIYREIRFKNPNEVKNMAAYAATCLRNGYYNQTPEPIKKIETRLPEPLEEENKQTPEKIEPSEEEKAENAKVSELLDEIRSMTSEEQERVYCAVLEYCKKTEKIIFLNLFKTIGVAGCITNNSINRSFLHFVRLMRRDLSDKTN
ncbi:MAG: replication initiation protein [Phascolarctobacterium sp.]|nr:replication initiation protein [Phascolarctobacterium sp.]MBR2039623.1 replication initiation protein [Phascolarctobacterium sp.]